MCVIDRRGLSLLSPSIVGKYLCVFESLKCGLVMEIILEFIYLVPWYLHPKNLITSYSNIIDPHNLTDKELNKKSAKISGDN